MSEDTNKTRDLRGLRERLGKSGGDTAASSSGVSPAGSSPSGAPRPLSVPSAGALPGGRPLPVPGQSQAPGARPPASVPTPPAMGGLFPPGGVGRFGGAAPTPQSSSNAPGDPFAPVSQAQAGPQQVRIVVDEISAEDQRVAQKSRSKTNFLVLGTGVLAGLALGALFGTANGKNELRNIAIRHAQEIEKSIGSASGTVDQLEQGIRKIWVAASPSGKDGKPVVDYAAIEQLRGLKNPFPADEFSRKNYTLFEPATVNLLFEYYTETQQAWRKVAELSASVTGEAQKRALEESASQAAVLTTGSYGCVPFMSEAKALQCGMVFIQTDVREGIPDKVNVSLKVGAPVQPKSVPREASLSGNLQNFVLPIDTRSSIGVLGQTANAFMKFRRDVLMLQESVKRLREVQKQLKPKLEAIAKLEPALAV